MNINARLLGSGMYLPARQVYSTEIDERMGLAPGTTESKTGVKRRHWVEEETVDFMAAEAARQALAEANLDASEIGLIVSAGATPAQLIPCNAVFYQRALGLGRSGIPSFDIDATCLSFMVALDFVSTAVASGRYKNALIISSEMASPGVNWKDVESTGLFGDGAVAFVVGPTKPGEGSTLLAHAFETYSSGADFCRIVGGGSFLPGYHFDGSNREDYLFHMEGRQLFKEASKTLPPVVAKALSDAGDLTINDLAMVIPHQASTSALTLMRRRLEVPEERWMQIIETHGNCIAASVPMALRTAVKTDRIKRGDNVMLLGTGAGVAVSAIVLRY